MPFLLLRDRRVSGDAKIWWLVISSQQSRASESVNLYADDISHLSGGVPIAEVKAWERELQETGYLKVSAAADNRSSYYHLSKRRIPPELSTKRRILGED